MQHTAAGRGTAHGHLPLLSLIHIFSFTHLIKETDDLDTYRVDAQCSTLQQDVGQHIDIYRALATLKEMCIRDRP